MNTTKTIAETIEAGLSAARAVASAALVVASAALVAWQECDHPADERCEHRIASDEADAALEKVRASLTRVPREWKLCEEGTWYGTITATSIEDANDAATARDAMQARMGAWLVDRTAAESSDHFRAKYEQACRERADYANAVRDALCDQRQSAGRSKIKREVLDSLEQAIRARSAKP